MKVYLIIIGVIISLGGFAQTGIGTTTPNASAKLDVTSSDKGFLPPRVALTATNAFAPITGTSSAAAGLLVYNTANAGSVPNNVVPGYYYWNGALWVQIAAGIILENKSASFILSSTDNNKIFLINSSAAVTVTVPALSVGFNCQFIQVGTGSITLAISSTTLNSANGLTSRATNSVIGLVMNTTSTGFVFGDTMY